VCWGLAINTPAWWRGCLLSAPWGREPGLTAPTHVSFKRRVEYSLPNPTPFSSGPGTGIGGVWGLSHGERIPTWNTYGKSTHWIRLRSNPRLSARKASGFDANRSRIRPSRSTWALRVFGMKIQCVSEGAREVCCVRPSVTATLIP
jgi:hypothetical protein